VVIGTAPEQPLAAAALEGVRGSIDLTGSTNFAQLSSLARAATFAVGNDTGPMHLIASAGCPAIVLFSRDSDPALCAPRGARVSVLCRPDLGQLEVAAVLHTVAEVAPALDAAAVAG
jgi:ADP-heptose:LPS heptosyltransferase